MLDEVQIITMIQEDEWMMDILNTVKKLDLPDWWICAGFVRSKIWDTLHQFNDRTPIPDIDVIYFEPKNTSELVDLKYEEKLKTLDCSVPWSVKNEARMHIKSNMSPYTSSVDAIAKFPETATALGVKLDEKNKLVLATPWGITDVVNLIVKPTPYFRDEERKAIYHERMLRKKWQATWCNIKVTQQRLLIKI